MSTHTPTGSRSVTSIPGGLIGIVSPKILLAAPPQYSKTLATRSISPRAALIGLPPFRASRRARVLLTLADQERGLRAGRARARARCVRGHGALLERAQGDLDRAAGVLRAGLGDLAPSARRSPARRHRTSSPRRRPSARRPRPAVPPSARFSFGVDVRMIRARPTWRTLLRHTTQEAPDASRRQGRADHRRCERHGQGGVAAVRERGRQGRPDGRRRRGRRGRRDRDRRRRRRGPVRARRRLAGGRRRGDGRTRPWAGSAGSTSSTTTPGSCSADDGSVARDTTEAIWDTVLGRQREGRRVRLQVRDPGHARDGRRLDHQRGVVRRVDGRGHVADRVHDLEGRASSR